MNGKTRRVLVVDDEPLVTDSLVQILNLFGYEAFGVYSSTAAIDRVRTHPCEFVVSDVIMHGHISGIELAIHLAALLPDCKVLLMSGNDSTSEKLKAAQAKGHSFDILPKPVHPDVILERLKMIAA